MRECPRVGAVDRTQRVRPRPTQGAAVELLAHVDEALLRILRRPVRARERRSVRRLPVVRYRLLVHPQRPFQAEPAGHNVGNRTAESEIPVVLLGQRRYAVLVENVADDKERIAVGDRRLRREPRGYRDGLGFIRRFRHQVHAPAGQVHPRRHRDLDVQVAADARLCGIGRVHLVDPHRVEGHIVHVIVRGPPQSAVLRVQVDRIVPARVGEGVLVASQRHAAHVRGPHIVLHDRIGVLVGDAADIRRGQPRHTAVVVPRPIERRIVGDRVQALRIRLIRRPVVDAPGVGAHVIRDIQGDVGRGELLIGDPRLHVDVFARQRLRVIGVEAVRPVDVDHRPDVDDVEARKHRLGHHHLFEADALRASVVPRHQADRVDGPDEFERVRVERRVRVLLVIPIVDVGEGGQQEPHVRWRAPPVRRRVHVDRRRLVGFVGPRVERQRAHPLRQRGRLEEGLVHVLRPGRHVVRGAVVQEAGL